MKTCEGCGAPVRLRLTACDYCRRDYEREPVRDLTSVYLASLQAQACMPYHNNLQAQMMNSQMQNSMGAAMGQYYNEYNSQQLGSSQQLGGGWWR